MKILKYVVLALIIPIFYSCDKEEPLSETHQNLLGTWESTFLELGVTVDNQPAKDYLVEELGITEAEAQLLYELLGQQLAAEFFGTIEFKADMTYETNFGGDTETGTWALVNSDQFIQLTTSDGVVELEIESITSSDLMVAFEEDDEIDITDDGTEEDIHMELVLTLEKQ